MNRQIIENAELNTRLMLEEASELKSIRLSDINELKEVYQNLKEDVQHLLDKNEDLLKSYITNRNTFAFVYDDKKKLNFVVIN